MKNINDPVNEFPDSVTEFRKLVRHWMKTNYKQFKESFPKTTQTTDLSFRKKWEDTLCANGWSGLGWPKEYGGKALSLEHQAIYLEELAMSGAPLGINLIGHGIFAPTLLHFGTEEQKKQYLPGILSNKTVWCQGYSEPGAGSDLAAVSCKATLSEGSYIINGQKIWTSFANWADYCFLLARTDSKSKRHQGLSFILVDMSLPGITVKPIVQLTGQAEFCEVFFDDVVVPKNSLLGAEGEGWKMAMAAASFERGTYFIPRLVQFREELFRLKKLIQYYESSLDTFALNQIQKTWSTLFTDSLILDLKARRALQASIQGDPPGPDGSSTKVHWSEAHQAMLDLAMEVIGIDLFVDPPKEVQKEIDYFQHQFLWSRAETILAGTSEIQRNIIAEKVMGLERG